MKASCGEMHFALRRSLVAWMRELSEAPASGSWSTDSKESSVSLSVLNYMILVS